jgi:hypothetical protein
MTATQHDHPFNTGEPRQIGKGSISAFQGPERDIGKRGITEQHQQNKAEANHHLPSPLPASKPEKKNAGKQKFKTKR